MKRLIAFTGALLGALFIAAAALSAQTAAVTDVRIEDFGGFKRVSLLMDRQPVYFVSDSAAVGKLEIELDATVPPGFTETAASGVRVTLRRQGKSAVLDVAAENAFKLDTFYFGRENKVIFDLYPRKNAGAERAALTEAIQSLSRQDTLRALVKLHTAIEAGSKAAQAHYQVGKIYAARGDVSRARFHFLNAVATGLPMQAVQEQLALAGVAAPVSEPAPAEPAPAADAPVETEIAEAAAPAADSVASTPAQPPQPIIVSRRMPEKPGILMQMAASPFFWAVLSASLVTFIIGFWLAKKMLRGRRTARKAGREAELRKRVEEKRRELERSMAAPEPAAPEEEFDYYADESAGEHAPQAQTEEFSEVLANNMRQRTPAAPEPSDRLPEAPLDAGLTYGRPVRQTPATEKRREARLEEQPVAESQDPSPANIRSMAERGMSVREIAQSLSISVHEVELVLGFGTADQAGGTADLDFIT